MKKFISFAVLIGLILTTVSPAFAIVARQDLSMDISAPSNVSKQIEYPTGEDFSKLKSLIETNFSPSSGGYRYDCIANNTLCPNYKYTSIVEKAIKLIVLKTFVGNEIFYSTLFGNNYGYTNDNPISSKILKNIFENIPRGSTVADWKSLGFGNSIGGELLDASFGVDFTENMNSSTMLGAIEQKIKDIKRTKCQKDSRNNNCYSLDLSNSYLPTQEELYREFIYLDRSSVMIGSLNDEIEYVVYGNQDPGISDEWKQSIQKNINPKIQNVLNERTGTKMSLEFVEKTNSVLNGPTLEGAKSVLQMIEDIKIKTPSLTGNEGELTYWIGEYMKEIVGKLQSQENVSYEEKLSMQKSVYTKLQNVLDERGNLVSSNGENPVDPELSLEFIKKIQEVIANPTFDGIKIVQQMSDNIKFQTSSFSKSENELLFGLNQYLQTYLSMYTDQNKNLSYILRYKKDIYTLEEARAELEKNDSSNEEFLVTNDGQTGEIPCKKYTTYLVRSQCIAATANLKEIQTALMAYNMDNVTYPETLDKLKGAYIMQFPQGFTDNFSYKLTKNSRGESDYEIRYIGNIGEESAGSGEVMKVKDYKAMIGGATVPEIPAIFSHIPSDSMTLYVRNPANLIELLNQKSNTSQRLSGIDASESIKNLMKTFFELEKFEQIEKNLKHDMAIVVDNLDATAPDIIIILSESDREALSPTGKARVVGSKGGFIFIASSKESLEKLTNLTVEKSMANAPDFQYVWWKKSALVKDALMFVGDEFFAKMLNLETYLTHYRKYRDYNRLTSLQELAWAYTDAFGKMPIGFSELSGLGLSTLTGEVLSEYSIVDGTVLHRNIGSLNSLKTLPETRYNLSKISRTEFEDYKYNVLQYRDIWRASLDPMGIVINRYNDGMEIDFFMTPIPSSSDRDLQEIQKIFEGVTKDSLSFVINSQIRMGLLSFVLGFDPQKLQTKIKSNQDIGKGFEEFSKEVLDGKNIFDYLGGEFAWSLGGLDPDIFEGWNVEKVDTYISIQVANETKGKELIDMLKKKFIGKMSLGQSSAESSIYSMLAKPLIEDYKGKKIYYVEAIPVPFVGKIGLAYTFVDDFFIMGLNRSTIRQVIDTAQSGDTSKKNLVSKESFEKGTFFATLFDGATSSDELKKLYQKNQSTIPRFFGSMIQSESTIVPLISSYYATEDRSRRLSKKPVPFQYELGSLSLSGSGNNMAVKMDPKKLTNLSGVTLEIWESTRKDPIFPTLILTEQGLPLDVFLAYPKVGDILSINMIVQLDSALGGSESLLRNMTFGMNIGDDEIGFKLRLFRQKKELPNLVLSTKPSNDLMMIGGVVVLLIVLGGVVWFIIRRRPAASTIVDVPSMPSTDGVVNESPVIVSSLIIPQDTTPIATVAPSVVQVDMAHPIVTPIVQNIVSSPAETPVMPVMEPVDSTIITTSSLSQQKPPETK